MKKIMLLLIISVCCCIGHSFAQAAPSEPNITSDTIPNYFLKPAQLNFLQSANSITAFQVHEFKATPGETNLLEEFRIKKSYPLTAEQTAQMKQLLGSSANYFITTKIKQCLFLPQMGLQVVAPNDTMNILFSFDCETVRFYEEGGHALFNLHSGAIPFSTFFDQIFPPINPAAEFASDTNPADSTANLSQMAMIMEQMQKDRPSFQPKMAALAPIHYIIQKDDSAIQLTQKVKNECDINIAIQKLCELNNLTPADLDKLQPGDAIIVGYEIQ